ncbi:MAG: hypothetical protein IJR28_04910 [Ottowia sp.]|nr:hypothetical protein [Ottowia sp.]
MRLLSISATYRRRLLRVLAACLGISALLNAALHALFDGSGYYDFWVATPFWAAVAVLAAPLFALAPRLRWWHWPLMVVCEIALLWLLVAIYGAVDWLVSASLRKAQQRIHNLQKLETNGNTATRELPAKVKPVAKSDSQESLSFTAAAKSRLQEVSSKPKAEKGEFSALGDVRFGITANVAKAGKYFIIADIANKSGALVRAVHSARVQATAPGKQEFTVTLERDYMARQKDALPLSVKSASLYVINGYDEDMLDEKEFNEPIPYEDASEFEEN